jgi:hypothetical protein
MNGGDYVVSEVVGMSEVEEVWWKEGEGERGAERRKNEGQKNE